MSELSITRNTSHGDWITRFTPATQDAKFGKFMFCAPLLSDRAYRELQVTLAQQPDAGDLTKSGGGLRKLRFMIEGRGKRGGIRVIY